MIPLNFALFFAGSKLSYLRYLTFKTLRHFHPQAQIQLFTTVTSAKTGHSWSREKQDFETTIDGKNYMDDLKDLDIEIVTLNDFATQYNSVIQSDIFRYWWLKQNGGFYLDTDQIILKSFNDLPLDCNLICSVYDNPDCGTYAPVGVLGSAKNSEIMDYISKNILNYYNPRNYNSSGPFMFLDVLKKLKIDFKDHKYFNAPSQVFYPIFRSDLVVEIFSGHFRIPDESYAIHWYGGHKFSQEFNKIYNEEFAIKSNDSISKFIREKDLI